MKIVLKRKNFNKSETFQHVFENIDSYCSQKELDLLVEQTLDEMSTIIRERPCGQGWSGGKDAMVCEWLLNQLGYHTPAVLGYCSGLEFPEITEWLLINAPTGTYFYDAPYDLDWLATHQQYLFPDNQHNYFFTQNMTRKAQLQFVKHHQPYLMIYGRRYADGNTLGTGPHNIMTTKTGHNQYFPIRHWPHEAVLAAIQYHQLKHAPVYTWPDGWRNTSYLWNGRADWTEVDTIDPSRVWYAATKIQSAQHYLDNQ